MVDQKFVMDRQRTCESFLDGFRWEIHAVCEGAGVAIIPTHCIASELKEGLLFVYVYAADFFFKLSSI
jgi:hypothetical protein